MFFFGFHVLFLLSHKADSLVLVFKTRRGVFVQRSWIKKPSSNPKPNQKKKKTGFLLGWKASRGTGCGRALAATLAIQTISMASTMAAASRARSLQQYRARGNGAPLGGSHAPRAPQKAKASRVGARRTHQVALASSPRSDGSTTPRPNVKVEATGRSGTPAVVNAAAAAPAEWKGANLKTLGLAVAVGVGLFFCPHPAGITTQAWHLLAVFVATIIGIITAPLPLGAVAMIGLCAAMMTKTLTFAQAFAAFSNQIPWLIAIAFFLAKGFIKTGLGTRIAYYVVSIFGSTTLGLTYSLVFSEALLAPAIPSLAARAGGIFLPLAKALCVACGSDPENGTENKMGAYLMKTFFQGTCISSAMFITAMAANPLSVNLAAAAIGETISWTQWAVAAFVPGLFCLITVPLILYIIYPPEVKDSPEAPKKAKEELAKLGPMGRDEKIMAVSLLSTVAMWVFGASYGINAVAAALSGLTILLVTGVISWKECLNENGAWNTFTWFAALISMAGCLNKFGLIPWFSQQVVSVVGGWGLAWQPAFVIIVLLYYYSHYLFASGAAHIGAMYTAFLSVAVACGSPPLMSALCLGMLSNIMGCFTTYGIGSAPPIFGTGYVKLDKWYTLGGILSVYYLFVWLGIGGAWWKVLGLW